MQTLKDLSNYFAGGSKQLNYCRSLLFIYLLLFIIIVLFIYYYLLLYIAVSASSPFFFFFWFEPVFVRLLLVKGLGPLYTPSHVFSNVLSWSI